MQKYEKLSFKKINYTGVITFRRGEVMNALNREITLEFHSLLEKLPEMFPEIRVVVITGEGRGFCSGADLSRMASQGSENRKLPGDSSGQSGNRIQELASSIRRIPQPVIAAVNGAAVGAGFSIALACDIRIASEEAKFSAIFVRRGLVPDTAVSSTLSEIAGHSVAAEMCLTGRIYDAEWAKSYGLVNHIVKPQFLMSEALKFAEDISSNPPLAVRNTKQLLRSGYRDWVDTVSDEDHYGSPLYDTYDQKEAVEAFLEKRDPIYRGD